MSQHCLRTCGATALLLALGGCFFLQENLPKDLSEGDVGGVAVGIPPGETGARRGLLGAVARRHPPLRVGRSNDEGWFVLRNLPPGEHRLRLIWDPNNDGLPDLVARVEASIRVVNGKRSYIDLGEVELLKPATVQGTVVTSNGTVTPGALQVVLMEPPDPAEVFNLPEASAVVGADNTFSFRGLGAGQWTLVAVHGSSVSAPVTVTLDPDEVESGVVLNVDLGTAAANGTIQAKLVPPLERGQPVPSGVQQGLTVSPPTLSAVPSFPALVTGCSGSPSGEGFSATSDFDVVFPSCSPGGTYTVNVTFDDSAGLLSMVIPNVLVPPGGVVDLGRLVVGLEADCPECFASPSSSSSGGASSGNGGGSSSSGGGASSGNNSGNSGASSGTGLSSTSRGGSSGSMSMTTSSGVTSGPTSGGSTSGPTSAGTSTAGFGFQAYTPTNASGFMGLPALYRPAVAAATANTSSGGGGERIFILGGCAASACTANDESNAIFEVDVTSNVARRHPTNLASGAHGVAAAVDTPSLGTAIYFTGQSAGTAVTWQFNANSGSFRDVMAGGPVTPWDPACMVGYVPDPVGAPQSAVLYAFGNTTASPGSARQIFRLTGNTWETLPQQLSVERDHLSCAIYKHPSDQTWRITVTGGLAAGNVRNETEELNISTSMVIGRAAITPTFGGRADATLVSCNRTVPRLYLIGGGKPGMSPDATVLAYDPVGPPMDGWLPQTYPVAVGRKFHGAAVTATRGVFLFGGSDGTSLLNTLERGTLPECQ